MRSRSAGGGSTSSSTTPRYATKWRSPTCRTPTGLRCTPVGVRHVGERHFVAYRGVVDDDVEPPPALRDRIDHRVDLDALRYIGRNQQRRAAARRDLVDDRLAFVDACPHVDG